jgi:mono/diheme cytochrome c family protein
MVRSIGRLRRSLLALLPSGAVLVVLAGCGADLKHPIGNLAHGKVLFVQKCGACHTLDHAQSKGQVGPNLDDAFRQDRADGVKSASIEGLVSYWIKYPNAEGVMPAALFKGQDAQDVAAYVGRVAAIPGQDTGALASAVASVSQKPAIEKGGVIQIDADPTGQLKYLASSALGTAGAVTIKMANKSSVTHDIAISGNGVNEVSDLVSNGGVATINTSLKPGKYTFFCTVPGHRAAGMVGTLTIK